MSDNFKLTPENQTDALSADELVGVMILQFKGKLLAALERHRK